MDKEKEGEQIVSVKSSNFGCLTVFIWFVGFMCLFWGLIIISNFSIVNFVSGVLLVIAGLIMFPPVRNMIEKKTGIKLSNALSCVLVFILFVIGIVLGSSFRQINSNLDNKSDNKQETIKTINMEKLVGFDLRNKQPIGDENIYTYNPVKNNDYSIAVLTSKTASNIHEDSYLLEKNSKDINGINVEVGYKDFSEKDGVVLTRKYEGLAFDFEYNNRFYSGEVSNLKGESVKEKLDEILVNFLQSVQGKS